VSRKFFSLIDGRKVHIAPDVKVLPAEDYSRLVDAEGLRKEVEEDAHRYRQQVAEECEALKEQAQRTGFEEGYATWADQLAKLEEELQTAYKKVQEVALPLALQAAKKIVGREISLNADAVVDIVASNLQAIAQHKRVIIYCNKGDLDILQKHKKDLEQLFERLETLSIRAREDVEEGGCVIETEAGIINAQLSNRWEALEQAFAKLLESQETL